MRTHPRGGGLKNGRNPSASGRFAPDQATTPHRRGKSACGGHLFETRLKMRGSKLAVWLTKKH